MKSWLCVKHEILYTGHMTETKKRETALQVVVPPDQRRALRIRAAEQEITVSELVRRLIRKELAADAAE
jgi:hypothetical protein